MVKFSYNNCQIFIYFNLTKKARMHDSNNSQALPIPEEDDILAFIIAIKSRYMLKLLA